QDPASLRVLLREHERVDPVADGDLVRWVDRAANRELRHGNDALRLVADVHEHFVLVDAYDLPVHDLPLVDRGEGGLVIRDQLTVRTGRPDAVAGGSRVGLLGCPTAPVSV